METSSRYLYLDVMRGIAIALMFIYHFCYDLTYFGIIYFDFLNHPFWLTFRTIIVSLFLLVVGISLHLATHKGIKPKPYFKRLGLLVLCSLLVSASSYVMFPSSMIIFGILQFIALASVVGLLFVRLYWSNLLLGIIAIILSQTVRHPFFDHPATYWFGLVTKRPVTQDYVPFLPWFGVVLIGLFIGRWLYTQGNASTLLKWQNSHRLVQLLALAGRHSLLLYMAHQPVIIGVMGATVWLVQQIV